MLRNMKAVAVPVAVVLLLFKPGASEEAVVSVWPHGGHVYLWEAVILTCETWSNSSAGWTYTWVKDDLDQPHGSSPFYTISSVRPQDIGSYRCRAQNTDLNAELQSKSVVVNVTAGSPPASLEVSPNSSQLLHGENFSLLCSGRDADASSWTLSRLSGTKVDSGCLKLGGQMIPEIPSECSFHNITSGVNGLYWCETDGQRSNTIIITVRGKFSNQSDEGGTGLWIWLVCITITLLLITVIVLLLPNVRTRLKFPSLRRDVFAHQEMPRTKQDVTEIQWDLAWMEMANLLDKPRPSS